MAEKRREGGEAEQTTEIGNAKWEGNGEKVERKWEDGQRTPLLPHPPKYVVIRTGAL